MSERYAEVVRVLYRVLFLNLAVAVAKIVLGHQTGAASVLSDGFHSLTDAASNAVGLVGMSTARRPPDANHPYGHGKYETMASVGILVFLVIVPVEVLTAVRRPLSPRLVSARVSRGHRRDGRDAGRQPVRGVL